MLEDPGSANPGGASADDADRLPAWPRGYDAIRRTVAWGLGRSRSLVVARGADAVAFIDNFTTAAVATLAVGGGTEAFFTDARGWVICLANILRTHEGLWIDVPSPVAGRLSDHLERHHIRERVEIRDESGDHASLVVAGPLAAGWLASRCGGVPPDGLLRHHVANIGGVPVTVVRIDAFGHGGFRLWFSTADRERLVAWLEREPIGCAEEAAWETVRIEEGVPETVDIPDKTLPQELGRDRRAISFSKGCYLGQETVARIDALGHVNRRFSAVTAERHGFPETAISAGDEPVGRLTSACFSPALGCWLGLGFVQAKAIETRQPLAAGGMAVRLVPLPVDPKAVADGEPLFEARRFRVVRVVEAGADGGLRHREVIRHPGSVVIVPLVSRDHVCLIEVVRVAVSATLLELPAGTLDRVETLEEAARRELAEETGYRAGVMTQIGGMWMSPGILRERMHLFVAEELEPGPQALEPGEQIRTRVVAWDEAIAMCRDGGIEDAKTIAGLLLVDARRRHRSRES